MELNIIDLPLTAYRGDTFNRQLFVISDTDMNGNEIPMNLIGFQFNMHIRIKINARDFSAHFTNDNFYFGSSEFADQYDIDNGNPVGTTKDELYILVSAPDMKFNAGTYLYDLEMKTTDPVDGSIIIITPIRGNFRLHPDITRDIEYN